MGRPLVPLHQRQASNIATTMRQVQQLRTRLDAVLPSPPGGGTTVTFSTTAPSSPATGDIWFDLSNGSAPSEWDGSEWVPYQWGEGALADDAVGSAQLQADSVANSHLQAGSVANAQLQAAAVALSNLQSGVTARALGGITTTVSGTAPASPQASDIWINSASGNQVNQYSGTAWTPIQWTATDVLAAGTVDASLIAANTITATQLAAGIVYGGIINGTTVNAATFTGSVFQGTDFLMNAAGLFMYAGTPGTGNLLASFAPVAGTDPLSGQAYPAGASIYASGNQVNLTPSTPFGEPGVQFTPAGTSHVSQAPYVAAKATSVGGSAEQLIAQLGSGSESGGNQAVFQAYSENANGSAPATATISAGGSTELSVTTAGVQVNSQGGIPGQVPVTQSDWLGGTNSGNTAFGLITKSWTIPANDANQGTIYRLRMSGAGNAANPENNIGLRVNAFGSNTASTGWNPFLGNSIQFTYWAEAVIVVTATGTNGTCVVSLTGGVANSGRADNGFTNSFGAVGQLTGIDTTATHAFSISAAFGTAAGGEIIGYYSTFERVGF